MIAAVKAPVWHSAFLEMLPSIQRHARISFRHLDPEAREELVQEVVANSLVAFHRLFSLGKTELAYPSVLARYGVAQARDGRRVGGHLNVNDVMSRYAQRRRGFEVEWIDHMMPEDRTATPAEVATARIDIRAWLETLSRRNRAIASLLAVGESTGATAKRFGLSSGRISQLRGELCESWEKFQGADGWRGQPSDGWKDASTMEPEARDNRPKKRTEDESSQELTERTQDGAHGSPSTDWRPLSPIFV